MVGATDAILSGEPPDISLPVRQRRCRSGKFAPIRCGAAFLPCPAWRETHTAKRTKGTLRGGASTQRR